MQKQNHATFGQKFDYSVLVIIRQKKEQIFSGLSCMFRFCVASFGYSTNEIPTSSVKLLIVTFQFSCHIFVVDGCSEN